MKTLFLFLGLYAFQLGHAQTMKTYSDSTYKYQIQYPDGWTPYQQTSMNILFLSPQEGPTDQFRENVNVLIQDLSAQQPMSLADFSKLSIDQIKQMAVADTAGQQFREVTFAGQKAQEGICKLPVNGLVIKVKQDWFVLGHFAYIITYTAEPAQFSRYEPMADTVMQSFKLQ